MIHRTQGMKGSMKHACQGLVRGLAGLLMLGVMPAKEAGAALCLQAKDVCFEVEVVHEPQDRSLGLMFREHLEEKTGMLFEFDTEGVHKFWMKNTLIPLDMIWLDREYVILHIERDVPPCEGPPCPVYGPPQTSLYVLEINAGEADFYGLAPGDRFER